MLTALAPVEILKAGNLIFIGPEQETMVSVLRVRKCLIGLFGDEWDAGIEILIAHPTEKSVPLDMIVYPFHTKLKVVCA